MVWTFGVSALLIVQEEAQHKAEIGKRYIHRLNKEIVVMKGMQIFIRLENALVFASRPGFLRHLPKSVGELRASERHLKAHQRVCADVLTDSEQFLVCCFLNIAPRCSNSKLAREFPW